MYDVYIFSMFILEPASIHSAPYSIIILFYSSFMEYNKAISLYAYNNAINKIQITSTNVPDYLACPFKLPPIHACVNTPVNKFTY